MIRHCHSCSRCVVTVNGVPVYGTVVRAAEATRLRVWAEEWATLGVQEGEAVALWLPGADVAEEMTVNAHLEVTHYRSSQIDPPAASWV